MNQTRLVSLIEAGVNTCSGFLLAFILWRLFVVPFLGIPVSVTTNLVVTTVFTVASIVRGYFWRRFFNNGLHRIVTRFVRRVL